MDEAVTAMTDRPIEETTRFQPRFGADGLIPCITTSKQGTVLMCAWMNEEALSATLRTGLAHYWSRSRQELWRKGAQSGALQKVREVRTDCDQDVILLEIETPIPEKTCHTGRTSCFYRVLRNSDEGPKLVFDE